MIGVASIIFDFTGAWVFKTAINGDGATAGQRRVSRTATLDGGVAVTDLGYSDGDRDLEVKEADVATEAVAFAKRIVETYASVTVTTADGAYLAAPSSYSFKDGALTLKLLLTEKLSE